MSSCDHRKKRERKGLTLNIWSSVIRTDWPGVNHFRNIASRSPIPTTTGRLSFPYCANTHLASASAPLLLHLRKPITVTTNNPVKVANNAGTKGLISVSGESKSTEPKSSNLDEKSKTLSSTAVIRSELS